jgi:hypothetical protein
METYIDGTGQEVIVHESDKCRGQNCVIHNPSHHLFRQYPTYWDNDRRLMYRVVNPNGQKIRVIDPDEMAYQKQKLADNAIVVE